ncbi:MAG: hypothetical protein RMA76_19765 [Deltaproteobacteria bacterium]|jgi:hypothetical protein
MAKGIAWWVVLATLAATEARAADAEGYGKRLAILPIVQDGPHGSASLSAIFGAITAAVQRRVDLRVITYEEMFIASQEGLVERVRNCGPNEGCIAARLRRFNARYGMIVVIDFELEPPLLSIQLLDTDASSKLGEHLGELTQPGEQAIVARLTDEAAKLLAAAGFEESGRLEVDVTPPSATVALEGGGAADTGAAGVFTLPPGAYRVLATAEGWEPGGADAVVKGGETTRVELALKEQFVWWKSPYVWGATGVVVASAVFTAVVVANRPDPSLCFRFRDADGCL